MQLFLLVIFMSSEFGAYFESLIMAFATNIQYKAGSEKKRLKCSSVSLVYYL